MKLRIEKAIYGGAGLGRVTDPDNELAGKAIFVPFTLPGEVIDAKIGVDKRSYASAELLEVLGPSAERVDERCEYFGRCGGCHYQHASYREQLAMKRAILAETLQRARIADVPAIEMLSGEPWEYRNRIRLVVKADPKFSVGYREQRSHAMVAVTHCPVAAPLLQRAIAALIAVGVEVAELCGEVELFTDGAQSSLMMSLLTADARPGSDGRLRKVCEALRVDLPELSGAVLTRSSAEEEHGRLLAKWGESSLLYAAAGFEYRISVGAFFQVNRFLIDALVELVAKSRSGRVAWDLYAGVGLFARALRAGFGQVIAVESAASFEDLQHNLTGTHGRAVRTTTRDFLLQQVNARAANPDMIVVDPPRAGLGAEVCTLLSRAAARAVVYVSCDPATMSRDLSALLQSGYSLQSLTLVDLFPQTFHMETVAVLARR